MIDFGSRARTLPVPPFIVWQSLTEPRRSGARPWLNLLPDESEPVVVEAEEPNTVVWSSLWPSRPDDLVRFELAAVEGGDTLLRFTLLTSDRAPDQSKTGHLRRRLNQLLFADLRYSYGQ
ncbi:SRPBCC family protein [Nocardia sp. NPDC004260]